MIHVVHISEGPATRAGVRVFVAMVEGAAGRVFVAMVEGTAGCVFVVMGEGILSTYEASVQ